MLKKLLSHPLLEGLDLDDPKTTHVRLEIVRQNKFLWRIYDEWYRFIAANLPAGDERVLELGSGAGFLGEYVPDLVTSEIFPTPGVALVLDGHQLPFPDASLRGIVMTDVLHHLAEAPRFIAEASRTLVDGGRIVMIEPWVSWWSGLVYRNLHHEPFDTKTSEWGFPRSGPLSGANMALPWVMLKRDRAKFERQFPELKIKLIRPVLPFRYLVSGGVSMRQLMPDWSTGVWRLAEAGVSPLRNQFGMFAELVLERSPRS